MKTVLLLSTYPFREPRHGGQVRMANIAKSYQLAGWKVVSVAVYEPEGYGGGAIGPTDVEFSPSSPFRSFKGRFVPLVNDLLSGDFAVSERGGYTKILALLPESIDAIHVEQPWLWPLVERLKSTSKYSSACTVYGSQNIEAALKQEILDSYGVLDSEDVIKTIEELERRATLSADLSLAVTQSDFEIMESWGASSLMLAPNGIAPWSATQERLDYWKARLPAAPWILYIASAHPPNFKGFNECIGQSLACIPPDSRLVVAGSVGEHLAAALSASKWASLNLSRLELLYILSDEDLAAVKTLATAFLLPIPHGGGSNIKTAEAIYSGKYVIGTESAFRGFDRFVNFPEIAIAKTPAEFHSGIRTILTDGVNSGIEMGAGEREDLTWERCLSQLPITVEAKLQGVH